METMQHLTLTCPFAHQTWHTILDWMSMPIQIPGHELIVLEWWLRAKEQTTPTHKKTLKAIALLVLDVMETQEGMCLRQCDTFHRIAKGYDQRQGPMLGKGWGPGT